MSAGVDASVIVPFFNAEPYIERCIRGLQAQDLPPAQFEILMVDNNSTDGSPDIVRRYPRVTLLREFRQSAYAARNRGSRAARGKVLVFLDPDCVPEPQWLQRLLAALADPEAKLVVGRVDPGSTSYPLRLLSAYEHHKLVYTFSSDQPALYAGYGGNMAVQREVFDALGLFVEDRRGGDTLFVIKAAETFGCDAVRYVPEARVAHLEISDLRTFYRKFFIYGRSRQRHTRKLPARRPLARAERSEILRETVRSEARPLVASAWLLALLALSVGSFHAGALVSRWSRVPS